MLQNSAFILVKFVKAAIALFMTTVIFTRTMRMLQMPRQNLTSFTGTLLEVSDTHYLVFGDWDELKEMTTVTSGDLASAIAVTVLEEHDRNLIFFI